VRRLGTWLLACVAGIAWLALSPPGRNDLVGGDEGFYGTMARNVLASREQLVSPSLSPLGAPGDKPPLYPLLIAPFVRAWGPVPASVRALSAPCAVVVAGGTGALVGMAAGPWTAACATALLATLP
jgi:4-amino-4-deoxy-L-arabinose transferase-like glycosyltransferase